MRSYPESEWDDEQQGWMLALGEYRASLCSGCGQDRRETTAKEGTHEWRVRKWRCLACDAVELAQESAAKNKQIRPGAVLWGVEKVR